MKVTMVVTEVGKGGAFARIAYHLTQEFAKKGLETALVTGRVIDLPHESTEIHLVCPKLVEKTANTSGFYAKRALGLISTPAFFVLSTRYMRKHKSELGITMDFMGLGGDVMSIHGIALRRAIIRWQRKEWMQLMNPFELYRLGLEVLRYKLMRFKIGIAVSNRSKQDVVRLYGVPSDKIVVIPNAIDTERFHPGNKQIFREKVRIQYNVPLDAPLLIFVAHNFWLKGLKFVIEALPKIRDAYLFVVGGGMKQPFEAIAEKLGVERRVIFTGAQYEVNKFYAASDLLIFPYESWALVCIEAMASGIPALASKAGYGDDYIRDGYNGFFIKRDPDDIAEKVNCILSDDKLRRELGRNARKTAEGFSWSNVADRYIEVFESLSRS